VIPVTNPPSDDQDPIPVTFLAVRPGARFVFPFHLLPLPSQPPRDESEAQRREMLARAGGEDSPEALCARVRSWLATGLESWGAGGKTAAGYGYFALSGKAAAAGEAAHEEPAQKTKAPITVSWEKRVEAITAGSATDAVPRLLAGLTGAERRSAAQAVVRRLGNKWLTRPERRDREWVRELLAAAESAGD
jgi:hypothetical protein